MNIQLKKIKVMEGREGVAFSADVYIENKYAGQAIDDGNGGGISISFYHEKDSPMRKLCDEAEAWAKTLPPTTYTMDGKDYSFDSDLEQVIENLFQEYLNKKEKARLDKMWRRGFAVGRVGESKYKFYALGKTITFEKMLAEKHAPMLLVLQSKLDVIKKHMEEGECFLNAEYLKSLGLVV